MKKLYALTFVLFLSVSILGCGQIQKATETIKPKPTKASAKAFTLNWFSLWDKGKYAEQYALIKPDQQKLISKQTFLEVCKTDAAQAAGIKVTTVVNNVELKGDTAIVSFTRSAALGNFASTDTIFFIDGAWRQQLEASSMIKYGVSPDKIDSIKKGVVGQQIAVPAYSVTISNPRTDKTATGSYGSRETAQGKYVMVDAALANTGKVPFRPNIDEEFKLSDSEGRSFSPSDKYMVFQPFGEIGPGMSESQTVGFDVPETAKGFILLIGKDQDIYSVPLGF